MIQAQSRLIGDLMQLSGAQDVYLSNRSEPRTDIRSKTTLAVLMPDGQVSYATALNASASGLGMTFRYALKAGEKVGVRLADDPHAGFEIFEVRRATSSVGLYRIGLTRCE